MTAWSSLPPELKQHVIKELDVVSRYCLRNTSHLDRKLVDSTRLKVPRVRFGYKDGRCLVVIYSGIEKFLRFELTECKDGVMYDKFENTFDPELANRKIFPTKTASEKSRYLLPFASNLLRTFLAQDAIQIQVMEWEFPFFGYEDKDTTLSNLEVLMEKKLRVKEIVFTVSTANEFINFVRIENYVKFEGLKVIRHLSVVISSQSIVPLTSHITVSKDRYGINCDLKYITENQEEDLEYMYETSTDQVEFSYIFLKSQMCIYQNASEKFETESIKREVDGDFVKYTTLTKCGKLVQTVHKCFERQFLDSFDIQISRLTGSSEGWEFQNPPTGASIYRPPIQRKFLIHIKKCGLGDLCKRCSDPFDYWYTQNLARRLYEDPSWSGVLCCPKTEDNFYERELAEWIDHFDRRQSRNAKIAKIKREGQTMIAYGFEKNTNTEKYEPIAMGYEVESDDTTVITIIRYLVISFIVPVFIAFVWFLWLATGKVARFDRNQ